MIKPMSLDSLKKNKRSLNSKEMEKLLQIELYQKFNTIDPKSQSKAIRILESHKIIKSDDLASSKKSANINKIIPIKSSLERLNGLPQFARKHDEHFMNFIINKQLEDANKAYDDIKNLLSVAKWKEKLTEKKRRIEKQRKEALTKFIEQNKLSLLSTETFDR